MPQLSASVSSTCRTARARPAFERATRAPTTMLTARSARADTRIWPERRLGRPTPAEPPENSAVRNRYRAEDRGMRERELREPPRKAESSACRPDQARGFRLLAAEQALGPNQEDQDDDREERGLDGARVTGVTLEMALELADHQPAEHRA